MTRIRLILVLFLGLVCAGAGAEEQKPVVHDWSAVATSGTKVQVPADGVCVVAFIRADQPQSRSAMQQISSAVAADKPVRVLIVVSGEQAAKAAGSLRPPQPGWPIVVDPDFAASGRFNVHVWPTTVIVKSDGEHAGHIAGLPGSFTADLEDYLAYAAGTIDADTLKQRLSEHAFVGDDRDQKANRQLIVARHLLESGQLDQAREQLLAGLEQRPDDPKLTLLLARVMLLQEQPKEALDMLDALPAGAAPAWQMSLLRGRALIDLERWDEASTVVPDAIKLNPHPAEAHYLMALIAQHEGNWQQASEEFRRAYEMVAPPR
jgi:hypothetical protein